MKRKWPLFFCLSAILAGLAFLAIGNWLPSLLSNYGGEMPLQQENLAILQLQWGLITLGSSLILLNSFLFLAGKSLSKKVYYALYLVALLACLLLATYITTL